MSRNKIFAVLLFFVSGVALGQKEEMVCVPCGHPCDGKVYPGTQCPTCRMDLVPKSTVNITYLTAKEFCARIAANPDALIIDVRSEKEFNGTSSAESFGYFKKAVNINVNQLSKRLLEIQKYKDKEVLVYCSHSIRSPKAAYYLNMQGFKNVKNLIGGVSKMGPELKSACFKDNYIEFAKK